MPCRHRQHGTGSTAPPALIGTTSFCSPFSFPGQIAISSSRPHPRRRRCDHGGSAEGPCVYYLFARLRSSPSSPSSNHGCPRGEGLVAMLGIGFLWARWSSGVSTFFSLTSMKRILAWRPCTYLPNSWPGGRRHAQPCPEKYVYDVHCCWQLIM